MSGLKKNATHANHVSKSRGGVILGGGGDGQFWPPKTHLNPLMSKNYGPFFLQYPL